MRGKRMGIRIGVLGATGAVGREMIKVIEEYGLDVDELRLLASPRSEGTKIPFRGSDITVHAASPSSFEGLDYVLGAVGKTQAREYAPYIVESGAVFIDNSSAFRMDPAVPLVVPEINGSDALNNKGIISNPNCSTIITCMAVAGINRLSPIETIVASTYQAVSGAGQGGLDELEQQVNAYVNGEEYEIKKFPEQIVMNVIPFIGSMTGNGYTDEEMKMQNEGRKILHLPELRATCTCVRVPVMRSHSISVTVKTKRKVFVAEAEAAIDSFPGVSVTFDMNGRDYPTPIDTSGRDDVYVGRVREDLVDDRSLTLWCCGDQIRKGAASNAVQILKYVEENK